VIAATIGFIGLFLMNVLGLPQLIALSGALAIAAVGFLDDRYQLSVRIRLFVHIIAAAWAVFWLGGMPSLQFGDYLVELGYVGFPLAVLALIWALNLFNFMDGTDGIAASEATFIGGVGGLTMAVHGYSPSGVAALVFAAACCGFLVWNWPPAKIFMGDVGSGYLGFVVGVLALSATRENPASLFVWLIAAAGFLVDATVTIIRRLLRGERVYVAHRSHAYQWLARRWRSHKTVLLLVIALNVVWLLPCALLAAKAPSDAIWVACFAFFPVVIGVIVAGGGRAEPEPENRRTDIDK
jgi:Fuc2NAc and GlcNAc transferase